MQFITRSRNLSVSYRFLRPSSLYTQTKTVIYHVFFVVSEFSNIQYSFKFSSVEIFRFGLAIEPGSCRKR
jgi:hypothetical protein